MNNTVVGKCETCGGMFTHPEKTIQKFCDNWCRNQRDKRKHKK